MNDLMIDLETMGNKPNAPIVAIGAVFFVPETGVLGPQFYTTINLASDLAAGAVPDGDTINWWLRQSSEARAAITSDEAKPITEAIDSLTHFVSRNCEQPNYLKVWGNGAAFDNVILREAYARCGRAPCWQWFNDLDVRTLVRLGRRVDFDPKRDFPFEGERHNALADAIHQARYVSAIWQRLLPDGDSLHELA
ncbi:3'-5' exonuclease [Serratia rhizosphaerae]|uniref:3'-5' exoribonuclease n=1 Tax=Serratia rhizosphaerae TaxID=2597702 RepID=A0ABX6GUD5_9GAMM|nr:3'-5' exonuclease [Serratia rhizosphaerae]QHA89794.1 3'-5' exoribonuclease [Serratia rhizosphaerae]